MFTREIMKRVSVLLIPVFLCAAGTFAVCFAQAQNQTTAEKNFVIEEGAEITVSGELFKIKMTQFPDNPWQELAIKDRSGKIFILIGKLVKNIRKDEGKKVTITGKVMPAMSVKGKAVPVIQIKEILPFAEPEKK